MNHLTKQDYVNLLKILETLDIKGLASAQYITGLAQRLGNKVEELAGKAESPQ